MVKIKFRRSHIKKVVSSARGLIDTNEIAATTSRLSAFMAQDNTGQQKFFFCMDFES